MTNFPEAKLLSDWPVFAQYWREVYYAIHDIALMYCNLRNKGYGKTTESAETV